MQTGVRMAWRIACGETSGKPPRELNCPGSGSTLDISGSSPSLNYNVIQYKLLYATPSGPSEGVQANPGNVLPPASSTTHPIACTHSACSSLVPPQLCTHSYHRNCPYPLLHHYAINVAAAVAITKIPPGTNSACRAAIRHHQKSQDHGKPS